MIAGETKDYVFPDNRAVTSWYHDHAVHITLENAYHGLAGMYIDSDKVKDGGCGPPYNLEVRMPPLQMVHLDHFQQRIHMLTFRHS